MTKKTILGQGAWYLVYGAGERTYIATTFTFDDANQLVSSTTDGVTTRYASDAAGRMVREGNKSYRYGYLDKVLSVTDGDTTRTFTYHADGQLASATVGGEHRAPRNTPQTETFLWDGLALIQRGDEQFVNEPHVGGGNPVASSKGTSYFNDALGTTVGSKSNGKYSAAALTAFGEGFDADKAFFTGKPMVEGLGHAFWMRNYRASLAKWQTADPMGYPDGWNQLAYCGNGVVHMVDYLGCVGHRVTDQSWGGWSGYTSEGGTSALFKVYAWGTCNHDFVNPSISPCGIAETAGSNTELVGFKYVNPKSSVDGMIGSLVFEYEVVGDSGTIVTPHEIFPNRTKYLNVDITVDLRLLFVYTEIIVVDGEEIEVQQQLVIESTQYVFHLACTVRKNIVEE